MRNRFTTRNHWFTETIETIRTSGLTIIISTMRLFKTFTVEFGLKRTSNLIEFLEGYNLIVNNAAYRSFSRYQYCFSQLDSVLAKGSYR
ncbi:MAG: hypothetical protein M9911_06085 [Saprospiraceae bacterium]|nr:hypothetical protein [Saprospiraceae bacterium]